jgi:hypothetical protein
MVPVAIPDPETGWPGRMGSAEATDTLMTDPEHEAVK